VTYLFALILSIGCIADGDPEFKETGDRWCLQGFYERVHFELDDETMHMKMYFTLNDNGLVVWQLNTGKFFDVFGQMLAKMAAIGVEATLQIRYGGDILGRCYSSLKIMKAICEVTPDKEDA
jgi:hypothetical protein